MFRWLGLASFTELKELGIFTCPGDVCAAEVKKNSFEALHHAVPDRQIQINGLHVPSKAWAPLELGCKGLDKPSLDFPLLEIDLKEVVVDIDQVKSAFEEKLGLPVQA